MKDWQLNVLFFVGVGGAILLLLGPEIGLKNIGSNPTAVSGIGAILAYILTLKRPSKKSNEDEDDTDKEVDDES